MISKTMIHLDDNLKAEAKKTGIDKGLTFKQVVHEALKEYIERSKSEQ